MLLVPASLLPTLTLSGGSAWAYAAAALAVGSVHLAAAVAFWLRTDDCRARFLLWASMVYLPLLLMAHPGRVLGVTSNGAGKMENREGQEAGQARLFDKRDCPPFCSAIARWAGPRYAGTARRQS